MTKTRRVYFWDLSNKSLVSLKNLAKSYKLDLVEENLFKGFFYVEGRFKTIRKLIKKTKKLNIQVSICSDELIVEQYKPKNAILQATFDDIIRNDLLVDIVYQEEDGAEKTVTGVIWVESGLIGVDGFNFVDYIFPDRIKSINIYTDKLIKVYGYNTEEIKSIFRKGKVRGRLK